MGALHCILSFNKTQLTNACLEQLLPLAQKRHEPVVLIHNGSEPQNIEKLRATWPQVQHFMIPQNVGFSGGANRGLQYGFQYATWIFFHTNDTLTLVLPDKLPDRPGLLAPKIYRRSTIRIDSIGGKGNMRSLELRHCHSESDFRHLERDEFPYVPGTAFLIHREVFNSYGGFDEDYHTYWEDVDFSFRIWRCQPHFLDLISGWELIHKVGKTCHKNPFYTRHLFPQNREKFRNKYLRKINP